MKLFATQFEIFDLWGRSAEVKELSFILQRKVALRNVTPINEDWDAKKCIKWDGIFEAS